MFDHGAHPGWSPSHNPLDLIRDNVTWIPRPGVGVELTRPPPPYAAHPVRLVITVSYFYKS